MIPLPYLVSSTLGRVVDLYVVLIVVWALFSWFDHSKGLLRDIYKVLDAVVGPFMKLFKRVIPSFGGIDISPIIAIILLQLLRNLLFR
jgi:YggT family protein